MWFEINDGFVNANKLTNISYGTVKESNVYTLAIYARLYSGGNRKDETLLNYEDDVVNRFNYVKDNIIELIRTKLALNNTEVLNLYIEALRLQSEYDRMTELKG